MYNLMSIRFGNFKLRLLLNTQLKYSPTCSTNWIDFINCIHNLKTVIKKPHTFTYTVSNKTLQNPPSRICLKFCDYASLICPYTFKEQTIKVNSKLQCCSLKSPRTLSHSLVFKIVFAPHISFYLQDSALWTYLGSPALILALSKETGSDSISDHLNSAFLHLSK